mmetsp:Transcript_4666/g.18676  ORF Transcript_4666/g.18676 Transcript_4666/m.18676 type:complete len:282 (+) Transcript_4666:365-1210(+)
MRAMSSLGPFSSPSSGSSTESGAIGGNSFCSATSASAGFQGASEESRVATSRCTQSTNPLCSSLLTLSLSSRARASRAWAAPFLSVGEMSSNAFVQSPPAALAASAPSSGSRSPGCLHAGRSTLELVNPHDTREPISESNHPGQLNSPWPLCPVTFTYLTRSLPFPHAGQMGSAPNTSPSTQRATSSALTPPSNCLLVLNTSLSSGARMMLYFLYASSMSRPCTYVGYAGVPSPDGASFDAFLIFFLGEVGLAAPSDFATLRFLFAIASTSTACSCAGSSS